MATLIMNLLIGWVVAICCLLGLYVCAVTVAISIQVIKDMVKDYFNG